ncbi:histidinol-phosphate transaminase [Canibacter oris]|uniref:Histidinol-phosphate aminotransferase n=1 Tax=Canibacter oris TaxID=1365628 RepID=A0A840DPL5_9MICO|nr:histidinol-phosphate transaminase [Canibacter oris]MBB4071948.1 histidinol-phosphate aminotransferase [Canibacter oris]
MAQLSDFPLRDNLKGKTPYGAPQLDVPIALNVNENTHPLNEAALQHIAAAVTSVLGCLNRYPEREFTQLREELAAYLGSGLTAENIWAANGSNETLQHILQAFGGPGRSLLSFVPSYSMYPLLAQGTDTAWIPVPRQANYELSPEYVASQLAKHNPTIAIICGPNNPTGTSLTLETVIAAYEAFEGILVIDEAYFEFEENTLSAVTLLEGRPRLVVSRTMSKAFSFAGVRLGYLAADPALLDALRLVRLPYHLSTLTQAAAVAAVQHAALMLESVTAIKEQRQRLVAELKALGLQPYQSGGNFLLVAGFGDSTAAFEALLAAGVLVRQFNIPGHLRLTVGTAAENTAMLQAIAAFLDTSQSPQKVD